jgi:Histidine kinase
MDGRETREKSGVCERKDDQCGGVKSGFRGLPRGGIAPRANPKTATRLIHAFKTTFHTTFSTRESEKILSIRCSRYLCRVQQQAVISADLNDKWFRIIAIPLSVPLVTLSQMPFFYPGRWDLWWRLTLVSIVFTILIWESSRWMIVYARRRWPGLDGTFRRVAFTMTTGAGWALLGHICLLAVVEWWGIMPFPVFTLEGIRNNFVTGLMVWMIFNAVYEAIYFSQNYRYELLRAEKLKKLNAQQQLERLKTRVNPHFLFNSLTTLSALIGEDPRRAERFLDELSKVYRYLLRTGRQSAASLPEELHFAESYAFLLQNRFENGAFSIQTTALNSIVAPQDEQQTHFLPILSLQNALDFLVRTQNMPLHIDLRADADALQLICPNRPKTLAFDAADGDWAPLNARGATRTVQDGHLSIRIPFTDKPPASYE